MTLSGWKRIGIIASVVWILGAGLYTHGRHSFTLEVDDGNKKQTVQFVVDKDTQVKGQVKLGTPVTVEYVAMADQNVAETITAQG